MIAIENYKSYVQDNLANIDVCTKARFLSMIDRVVGKLSLTYVSDFMMYEGNDNIVLELYKYNNEEYGETCKITYSINDNTVTKEHNGELIVYRIILVIEDAMMQYYL